MDLGGDRGYGSHFLEKLLTYYGISSPFIMPQHLIKCYPFVIKLLVTNNSSKNEDDNLEEETCNEKAMMNKTLNWVKEECTVDRSKEEVDPNLQLDDIRSKEVSSKSAKNVINLISTGYDRRKTFIIDNRAREAYDSYYTVKQFVFKSLFYLGAASSAKKLKITAFAVSEYRNQKFNNIIRTLFCHEPGKNGGY